VFAAAMASLSPIQEIRARQLQQPAEKGSLLPMIAGTVAAFVAGILLVMGWGMLPSPTANIAPAERGGTERKATVPSASGARTGRAEAAALLRTCLPRETLGLAGDNRMEPADIYRLLQAGSHVARVAAVANIQQNAADPLGFASMWGEVADCVFRQNGWMLCNPDNRALAVEAVNTFVRQVGIAETAKTDSEFHKTLAAIQGNTERRRAYAMNAARATKDRVLAALRTLVQEGRLVAGDFGFFVPADVKNVLRSVKTERDSCAAEAR
jgi:hypothetical protein